jgi:hypothetical protein
MLCGRHIRCSLPTCRVKYVEIDDCTCSNKYLFLSSCQSTAAMIAYSLCARVKIFKNFTLFSCLIDVKVFLLTEKLHMAVNFGAIYKKGSIRKSTVSCSTFQTLLEALSCHFSMYTTGQKFVVVR